MNSERFTLNNKDIEKWFHNAVVFLTPAALIFLIEIQSGKSLQEALLALKIWALNTMIDLLRKYIAGNPQ